MHLRAGPRSLSVDETRESLGPRPSTLCWIYRTFRRLLSEEAEEPRDIDGFVRWICFVTLCGKAVVSELQARGTQLDDVFVIVIRAADRRSRGDLPYPPWALADLV